MAGGVCEVRYMCGKLRKLNSYKDVNMNFEKTAFNLFADIGYDNLIPVNIENIIIDKLDIPIYASDFKASEDELKKNKIREGVLGKVQVAGENINIFYNPNALYGESEHRKRFTLAHELSHCILHAGNIGEEKGYVDFYRLDESADSFNLDNKSESEANILAGAILIPDYILNPLFSTLKENRTLIETISELAKLFKVSNNVMRARMEYLNLI